RMHAGKLDMLQHAANDGKLPVADAVDVELDGVFEEFVDQDRFARHDIERLPNDRLELFLRVNDEHATAAQNERRPKQHGESDFMGKRERIALVQSRTVGRLQKSDLV